MLGDRTCDKVTKGKRGHRERQKFAWAEAQTLFTMAGHSKKMAYAGSIALTETE